MSTTDSLVLAMARELHDEDRLFTGVNQHDAVLAAALARQLWAPHLRFWAAGTPVLDAALDELLVGRPSFDPLLYAARGAFFWQARAFDAMGTRSAVCFAGGLQVDARGNANLAGIRADGRWQLRGPGSAGLPSLTAWANRFYLVVADHSTRTLVPTCSAVTVVGDPVRRKAFGMDPQALRAVLTPLARFEPTPDGLVLTELEPGWTPEAVAERTGFPLQVSADLRDREKPTDEERRALDALRAAAARNRQAAEQ
jgi:acyl CoA:acetate/3-ketoacid CoA transferase beta subunit